MAPMLLLLAAACVPTALGMSYNASFAAWNVRGPVKTGGGGYVTLTYQPGDESAAYLVLLRNTTGVKAVYIYIGDPSQQGLAAVVLYRAAFDNTQRIDGVLCSGLITQNDLIGPLLLPLGYRVKVSELMNRYVTKGQSTVIIHTFSNPRGELAACPANDSPNPALKSLGVPSMAPMSTAGMGSGAMKMPSMSG